MFGKKYYEKKKTCFKNSNQSTCVDLLLRKSPHSFQNNLKTSTGLSDPHKMIITVLKSSFIKFKTKEIYYRGYKNSVKIF